MASCFLTCYFEYDQFLSCIHTYMMHVCKIQYYFCSRYFKSSDHWQHGHIFPLKKVGKFSIPLRIEQRYLSTGGKLVPISQRRSTCHFLKLSHSPCDSLLHHRSCFQIHSGQARYHLAVRGQRLEHLRGYVRTSLSHLHLLGTCRVDLCELDLHLRHTPG